jgi:hypothetical protein
MKDAKILLAKNENNNRVYDGNQKSNATDEAYKNG